MTPKLLHPFGKPGTPGHRNLVKSEGVRLWDDQGNEYIDGLGSLWLCQVGWGRPEIIQAVTDQLSTLVYNHFPPWGYDIAETLADKITSISPLPDGRVYMCCSGSEAIDSAFKIARATAQLKGEPDRQIMLRRTRGYPGVTGGGTSRQGIEPNRTGFGDLMPHIIEIDPENIESAASVFAEHGPNIAGVISEPVQGAGGVFPPNGEYLQQLRDLCTRNGSLMILDEVITGFGRTGSMFAAQTYGVTPDLITFAKGVTSGYQPLGGVIVSRDVCDVLEADPDYILRHGHTYSAHPASCAAALVNIDIIEREGLADRANHIGERLSAGLQALADDGSIREVRGVGAIWAARLNNDDLATTVAVRDRMLDLGVVVRPIGDSIAFCPPLIMSDEDVDTMVDALAQALRDNAAG